MLDKFFKLKNPATTSKIEKFSDFAERLQTSKHLCNLLYMPDELKNIKIEDMNFENMSFSKTSVNDVILKNCTFKDCLFIGTNFVNGSMHNCKFISCNFFKATFKGVYAKPHQFKDAIQNNSYANIAVSLFNQLRNVYKEDSQKEYKSEAEYYFYKWKRIEDYMSAKHEGVKWYIYTPKRIATWLYGVLFGFGYRLRNLIVTTILTLSILIAINHCYDYLIFKSVTDQSIIKSVYFTITTMATLGASGVSEFTKLGYFIVIVDVLIGISLLTVTINSVFKKVLK